MLRGAVNGLYRGQDRLRRRLRNIGSQSPTKRRPFVFVGQLRSLPVSDAARPAHRQPLFVICAEEDHVAVSCAPVRSRIASTNVGGQELTDR